jgi:O-antigen/teichoic acid export membrane protein
MHIITDVKKATQRLWVTAWKSEALRQSITLLVGTTLTGIIMAVAMIIVSRALGPTLFGVFSVSIAIMSLLAKCIDLGLNQLIPRLLNKWHSQPQKTEAFISQVLYWKVRLVGVTIAVGVLSIPFLTQALNYPHIDMILWSIAGALSLGLYEYVYLLLSAKHLFGWVNVLGISQAIIKITGFGLLFLLATGNLNGIAAVYYLAPFISSLAVGWQFKNWMWVKPTPAPKEVRNVMFTFLNHAFVGVIAMTLIANLDVLLVQRSLNTFDTGIYAGATRIASFIGFATAAIGGVLNNRASRYRDTATLKKYLIKSTALIGLAVFGFLLYLPFARLSLVLTIGPEYLPGLQVLTILVFNAFLSLAIVPYISFFYAVEHPEYFSLGGILQVAIIIVGNWWFLPIYGIEAAAWTKVISQVCFGVFTTGYVFFALAKLKK